LLVNNRPETSSTLFVEDLSSSSECPSSSLLGIIPPGLLRRKVNARGAAIKNIIAPRTTNAVLQSKVSIRYAENGASNTGPIEPPAAEILITRPLRLKNHLDNKAWMVTKETPLDAKLIRNPQSNMNEIIEFNMLTNMTETPNIRRAPPITKRPPYLSCRYPVTRKEKAPTSIPSEITLVISERVQFISFSIGVTNTPIDDLTPNAIMTKKKQTAKTSQP
jgi:hypothetical protein